MQKQTSAKSPLIAKAAIMAAGLGTRLRPLTNDLPKPLISCAKRPMILYTLDLLERVGIQKTAVNLHYHSDKLRLFLQNQQKKRKIKIVFSDETKTLLDSGGGVKKMQSLLGSCAIMVCNCDTLPIDATIIDAVSKMKECFDATKMDVFFLVCALTDMIGYQGSGDFYHRHHYKNDNKNGDIIGLSMGVASEGKQGEQEKKSLLNTGIYIIRSDYLSAMPSCHPFSIVDNWRESARQNRLFGYYYSGKTVDLGHTQGLQIAQSAISKQNSPWWE